MKNKSKVVYLILLLIILSMVFYTPVEARLGVGPNYILEESALRNSTYKYTVFIYNENEYDSNILFEIVGNIQNWTNIYEYKNFSLPINNTLLNGSSSKPVLVEVSIPEDASNGIYNGTIYVTSKALEKPDIKGNYSTVEISLPVEISMNITGDQNYNLSVEYINIDDVEINYPLKTKIHFKNNGNVIASPTIDITISKDGMYIDKISSTTPLIKPLTIYNKDIEWNTTGKISGKYNAHILICEDENIIKDTNISFELLPPGTFTLDGILKDIKFEGELKKGKIIKIIATFVNTGDIETKAQFIAELYRNGELIGTLESHESNVPKYHTREFISYLRIDEEGDYVVKGFVLYSGRTTDSAKLKFNVSTLSFLNSTQFLIFLFIIMIIILIVIYTKFRKKSIKVKKKIITKKPKLNIKYKIKRNTTKTPTKILEPTKKSVKHKHIRFAKKKKKDEITVKRKSKKPKIVRIENMSAKEIEDYVKSL